MDRCTVVEMTGISRIAVFYLSATYGIIQYLDVGAAQDCVPRKTVTYQSGNLNIFWNPEVSNFSTLLVSEETDTLYAAAKDSVLALDLHNVSNEISRQSWFATEDRQLECLRRGKSKEECQNYVLLLHKINATCLYVCGTNAFNPACRYMVMDNMKLRLQGKAVESRGTCPFEPTLSHASLMVDGALYSATSNNFLGTEPIILRSLRNPLRTEFKASWLNEPDFVHMELVQQDSNASTEADDRIFVFFTETAVDFEFYDKLLVSRIAQICKSDLGGKRILKNRWTSFLKSTLVCSAPQTDFQFNVVQDVFALKATNRHDTIFYGIFTQQWGRLDISAVCAFRMEAILDVFLKGSFKEPLSMEQSHVRWGVNRGEVPTPRPGVCLDVSDQRLGYSSSLDLPERVLQFARDHPLMAGTVKAIGQKPVLLKRGTKYTRLVVHRTIGVDNATYSVLFLGTDKGYLHKALHCHGKMFIVEEMQLFPSPEPVQALKLAPGKGLLYAGSASRLVQLPVATCSRYQHCSDCVLGRDPYCAWSQSLRRCVLVAKQPQHSPDLIQSIRTGGASQCPEVERKIQRYPVSLGSSPRLHCIPLSNLANTVWTLNGSYLQRDEAKYMFHARGLVIFNVTFADIGHYACQSVELTSGKEFHVTMASYLLSPLQERDSLLLSQIRAGSVVSKSSASVPPETDSQMGTEQPRKIQGTLLTLTLLSSAFAFLFLSLLSWNLFKGHLSLCWKARDGRSETVAAGAAAKPALSLEHAKMLQRSSTTCTITSSIGESAPLASPSEEGGYGIKVKHGTSLTEGPAICTKEAKLPGNDCAV